MTAGPALLGCGVVVLGVVVAVVVVADVELDTELLGDAELVV